MKKNCKNLINKVFLLCIVMLTSSLAIAASDSLKTGNLFFQAFKIMDFAKFNSINAKGFNGCTLMPYMCFPHKR